MLQKITSLLLLILVLHSCKKHSKVKSEVVNKTTSQFINFENYTFNTLYNSVDKIAFIDQNRYILDFWYLECAPCIKQHKEIEAQQGQLLKNNIEVIGISIDKSKVNWMNYIKKHQYSWKNYNQFKKNPNLKEDLDIQLFPMYFLVDSKGIVEKKFNSFQKVMAYLNL